MDNGNTLEVRLHSTPEEQFRFEISAGPESAIVPIEHSRLNELLNDREVRIESPSFVCHLAPTGTRISFYFSGHVTVSFTMTRELFARLTRTLGLEQASS